jgi:hypothetical protein
VPGDPQIELREREFFRVGFPQPLEGLDHFAEVHLGLLCAVQAAGVHQAEAPVVGGRGRFTQLLWINGVGDANEAIRMLRVRCPQVFHHVRMRRDHLVRYPYHAGLQRLLAAQAFRPQ